MVSHWLDVIPESERAIYEQAGYNQKQPYGSKPALLIIDVVTSFAGSRGQTLSEAIAQYRTACGEAAWKALPHIKKLIEACRTAKIPVIYSKTDLHYAALTGGSTKSALPGMQRDAQAEEILPEIAPEPGDLIISKTRASAFFKTPLTLYLTQHGIDMLFVCGTSTSGCVRASTVDAFSHGYRTFLVEECCFDRSYFSHAVSLFEMNAKYADVIPLQEALDFITAYEQETRETRTA